jgi:hypothetical protein
MRGSGISSWMLLQYALASVWHPSRRDSVDTKEDFDKYDELFCCDRPFIGECVCVRQSQKMSAAFINEDLAHPEPPHLHLPVISPCHLLETQRPPREFLSSGSCGASNAPSFLRGR